MKKIVPGQLEIQMSMHSTRSNGLLYFKRFFSGTFLSRISGLLRDLLTAFLFGDHPSLAAFIIAFRFSNLFRRLLGEGPFQSVFIPHFVELRVKSTEQSSRFFRQLMLFVIIVCFSFIILCEGGLSLVQRFFVVSHDNNEIVTMCKWMIPGVLFICLYGLNISLLQCYNIFFIPNVAPAFFNGVWIVLLVIYRSHPPSIAMLSLSKWLFLGFLGQWLITLPGVIRQVSAPLKEWMRMHDFSAVKRLFQAYSYGLIGVGAVQINMFADGFFARAADLHGPVYLWNAIRLQLLVMSLFGIAMTSTVIPTFSKKYKENQRDEAQQLLSVGTDRILTMMTICMFAVFTLATPAVNLVFGRGHFLDTAVAMTAGCLGAYGFSLVPATMCIFLSAVFFAQGDYRTPMKVSLLSVVINLILNALFVFGFHWGAESVALATAFSSWINYLIFKRLLQKAEWEFPPLSQFIALVLVCLIATGCTLGVDSLLFKSLPRHILHQLSHFSVLCVVFFSVLLSLAALFRIDTLLSLFKAIKE